MEHKVLVKIYVPEIEEIYEAYIPVNKTVDEVSRLLNQLVNNLSSGAFPAKKTAHLCNRYSGAPYDRIALVRNTDIRNDTELILLS